MSAKPLEWQDALDHSQDDVMAAWAAGIGGRYAISIQPDESVLLWWAHDEFIWEACATVEEAKVKAEADWQTRYAEHGTNEPAKPNGTNQTTLPNDLPTLQVGEGWRSVPVEPTREMLNAAIDVDSFKLGDISPLGFRCSPQQLFERCWAAMLEALPSPPQTEGDA